jgi:putative transposase
MARRKKSADEPLPEPLPTIWNASDELWERVEKVLEEHDPPADYGPDRIDQRAAFDGVIYRLRSGVQWNRLPACYGDDSSVHRTFQRWVKRGVMHRLWAELVRDCAELGGVDWQWQSADCALGKARHGGIRSATIRRIGPKVAASVAS